MAAERVLTEAENSLRKILETVGLGFVVRILEGT